MVDDHFPTLMELAREAELEILQLNKEIKGWKERVAILEVENNQYRNTIRRIRGI